MAKRKRETWTFQPDDDIVALAKSLFGEEPTRGERTQLINEAIRLNYPESVMLMAEQEVAEANARLRRMREMIHQLKRRIPQAVPVNDALEKAVEGSSRAARLAAKSGKKQTTESPNENKSSREAAG